jgi:release factor glutamine methyltransferase
MRRMSPDSAMRALLEWAQSVLAQSPHPERARQDAESLLLHICERSHPSRNRAWLLAHIESPADPREEQEFRALVERRLPGEPIQYILGEAEFYGLPFFVTPDVLIPRPETEHLVEKAIELLPLFSKPRIVDIGTGSGIIAIALAHEWPSATVTATDVSASALDVARRNADRNGLAGRIRFLMGDLLTPIAAERFEIIASNPPYVPETDRTSLAPEVRDYEPGSALFAGQDGLSIYRRLIPAAFDALVPGGFLVLEIGYGQQSSVSALLESSGFRSIEFTADLQSIPRVAAAQRP